MLIAGPCTGHKGGATPWILELSMGNDCSALIAILDAAMHTSTLSLMSLEFSREDR